MALAFNYIHVAILFCAATLLIAAAVSDAQSYRIPNYLSGSLALLFPIYAVFSPTAIDWRATVLVFAATALAGFAALCGNVFGAGDVKLLSAASLWAGPHLIALLLVVMAFVGGIESLAVVFALRRRGQSLAKAPVPYGVAIAAGGLATLGVMARTTLLSD